MSELYKVTTIRPVLTLLPNGQIIDSYEINFETKSGIPGKIEIPVKDFTKENVMERIDVIARPLEEVVNI